MPSPRATRNIFLTLAVALALSCFHVAHAATVADTPPCSVAGDNLRCHLLGFLHFLYATAGFLALILVVVAALAIRFYRRNKTNPKAGE